MTHMGAAFGRDRNVLLAGLAALVLLAWLYLLHVARATTDMPGMDRVASIALPRMQSWSAVELLLLWFMWAVMMVAMMIPSVTPLIMIFARVQREKLVDRVVGSAATLVTGYLIVWTLFASLAALLQWWLHRAALLSDAMVITSSSLAGVLLIAAGGFQFTRLKRACLVHCRSPMAFLMTEWRSGRSGTLVLGLKHGAYCVGCCWLLMALLLAAGVMNLFWVAAIAAFVLIEKLAPNGALLGRVVGALLVVAGIALIVT